MPSIVRMSIVNCGINDLPASMNCGNRAVKKTIALGLLMPTQSPSLNTEENSLLVCDEGEKFLPFEGSGDRQALTPI